MDVLTLVLFLIGIVLLIAGAELLVRGASALAAIFGISPLVVGLTVVAYGTSAPELAVSIQSGLSGQSDIALGNIVGSNIVNVLGVLGISAAVAPLVVARRLVRLEVPLLIAASVLLWLFALNGRLGPIEGGIFVAGLGIYTVFLIRASRREELSGRFDTSDSSRPSIQGLAVRLAMVLAGLALLVLGARWLVAGAVELARTLGVTELIIGLTVVAIGTSLPEIATSLVASLRGERDIAVGNIVGSSVCNILLVLGMTSLILPGGIIVAASARNFDIPVMTAVAIVCLPIFFTGHLISRREGLLLLGYYAAYVSYLFLRASEHAALGAFSVVMLAFVVPLTALALATIAVRAFRERDRSAGRA
ncbi:calcium/sodium antiporter [soil metagenome]